MAEENGKPNGFCLVTRERIDSALLTIANMAEDLKLCERWPHSAVVVTKIESTIIGALGMWIMNHLSK